MVFDDIGNIYVTSTNSYMSSTPNRVYLAKFSHNKAEASWITYIYLGIGNTGAISGVDLKRDFIGNLYELVSFYNGSYYNYDVLMYTPSGGAKWQKIYGSSTGDNIPVSLALSNLSSPPEIYVTGYTFNGNINTVKYNNNGDTIWTKIYDCGNNGVDIAAKMVTDDCDNLYITGSSNCNGTSKDVKTIKYATATAPTITPAGPIAICYGNSATLTSSLADAYLWSNGATTNSITVSSSGNYTVTVTNADGCTVASTPTEVIVNLLPTATINPMGSVICQGSSATLTANICTGCSYLWSSGQTTPTITVSPMATTSYTITVTNSNNCSAVSPPAIVTVNSVPVVTAAGSSIICIGNSANLSANGATTYNWSPATGLNNTTIPNPIASPLTTISYTVTGITNGCSGTATLTITVVTPPAQPGTISGSTAICSGSANTYSIPVDTGATSYTWTLPSGWPDTSTSNSITTIASATGGNITVMANNGCGSSAPQTLAVSVNTAPAQPGAINGPMVICSGSTNIYSIDTVMRATSYSWVLPSGWPDTSTTNSITVNANATGGNIYVTANNSCGSSTAQTLLVTVSPLPTVDLGADITIAQGQQAVLNATCTCLGYLWSTGATTSTIIVDTMGIYTVTVTNSAGCSAIDSILVMTTSTTNPLDKYQISVSPNPIDDIVLIICQGSSTSSAQIIDNLGKIVSEDNTFVPDGVTRTLSLGKIPSGVYYLRIVGKEFARTVSILKH